MEDQGIRHAYTKATVTPNSTARSSALIASVKRSFYQLLTYKDDVDLKQKLAHWERFNNLSRPHGAFNGKAPYEALREAL